ncbi:hypothetical protein NLU13_0974 [Sarocladium strictum]|uniref:G-patch domain-containing protein n=1 Tax=Sarocladium strictum TaxID=5046 RepID=A0AA39LBS7_SARSR|nr:hypothetical protein NLU13_0974 [Sarocladium strictum]
MRRSMVDRNDEGHTSDEDDVPLHHRRPFGSGLKRQRVEFVRAQDPSTSTLPEAIQKGPSSGDIYANIVLSGNKSKSTEPQEKGDAEKQKPKSCPVCNLSYTTSLEKHEATLAHQVSLTHSHPPSALDRSRMGLRTLASAGWDPDARIGLGRDGEGMRFPIKVSAKEDNLGIGASAPEPLPPKEEKPKALKARERKELEKTEKRKGEKLQQEIFGRVDVDRYLRGETSNDTGLRN